MRKVYDVFLSCNVDKLIEEYKRVIGGDFRLKTDDERKAAAKYTIEMSMKRINETECRDTDENKNCCLAALDDDDLFASDNEPKTYLRVFVMKLSDIRLWAKVNERLSLHTPFETISDISQYTDDELSEILHDNSLVDTYAIEFSDWEDILAWHISETSLKKYGVETVLAYLLQEMTFFGVAKTDTENAQKDLEKSIREVEEAKARGENPGVPFEEAIKEIADSCGLDLKPQTEEEKAKFRHEALVSNFEYQKKLCSLLHDILNA